MDAFGAAVTTLRDLTGEQSNPRFEEQFNAEHQTGMLDALMRSLRSVSANVTVTQ
jgi:hypothetical protein